MGAVKVAGWGGRRTGAGPKPRVKVEDIVALRKRRYTWEEIAEELRISPSGAMKALKRGQKV